VRDEEDNNDHIGGFSGWVIIRLRRAENGRPRQGKRMEQVHRPEGDRC